MSSNEEYEKLLKQRIAEREERWKGLAKEQAMMNSNYKQPVYTQFSPDNSPEYHYGVFSLDLDPDKETKHSSNNVSSTMTAHTPVHKPVPTLAELASRKGRLHTGGKKSKKNRRRTSRRHRVRSSRRR